MVRFSVIIDKAEAERSMVEIRAADARSVQRSNYNHAAPHLIIWGLVWLIANSLTDFLPRFSGMIWLPLTVLGFVGSFWAGVRRSSCDSAGGNSRARVGWRWGLSFITVVGFFVSVFALLPPLDARQHNAFISLFWMFLYAAAGIWIGWRLFWVGAITIALILFGFFMIDAHYFLYMGMVGGTGLIVGGLWLRRI